ncbi:MAG: hypothetical protein NVSMB51_19740 [Solirubrobacteraceae bacterium]
MKAGRTRQTLMLCCASLCALALSACGGDTKDNHRARNEGIYVDIGQLKYQVQLSRELNPYDVEDASYLAGLAPADRALGADQAFFGVFLLVFNKSGQPRPAAGQFYITDTQGSVFKPTALGPDNPFAYRPITVPGHDQIPAMGSAAANSPTQGAVSLYKMSIGSFDNRPLILHIVGPAGDRAEVELDV